MDFEDQTKLTLFEPLSPVEKASSSSSVSNFFGKLFRGSSGAVAAVSSSSHASETNTSEVDKGCVDVKDTENAISTVSNGAAFSTPPPLSVDTYVRTAGHKKKISPSPTDSERERSIALAKGSVISAQSLVRTVPKSRISNVTNRLSNLFTGSRSSLTDISTNAGGPAMPGQTLLNYNMSDFRQYWMPDSRGKECYECHEKFTAFRRRHHCRICGQIFCSRCCNQEIPGHLLGYMGDLRLCNYCCKSVIEYLNCSDENQESHNPNLQPLPSPYGDEHKNSGALEIGRKGSLATTHSSGNLNLQNTSLDTISLISHGPRKNNWSPEAHRNSSVSSSSVLKKQDSTDSYPSTLSVPNLAKLQCEYEEEFEMENCEDRFSSNPSPVEEEECEPDWLKNIEVKSGFIEDTLSAGGLRNRSLSFDRDSSSTTTPSPRRSKTQPIKPEEFYNTNAEGSSLSRSVPASSVPGLPSPGETQVKTETSDEVDSSGSLCSGKGEHGNIQNGPIAYSLSSMEYEKKRKELREALGEQGLPLTLKNSQFLSENSKENSPVFNIGGEISNPVVFQNSNNNRDRPP